MGFKSIILMVEDIMESRKLYDGLLGGCKVEMDFGTCNVGYEGGFALFKKSEFSKITDRSDINTGTNNLTIYFEFEDINDIREKIIANKNEFLHDIKEQPWGGQKVFRFYDRDKHIVEIAESMDIVLKNMYESGKTFEDIALKTGYSVEAVKSELQKMKIVEAN